jgi:hypothetical protein
MVAKSIREAKSTVTACPPERTETGLEPDCGVNVRPLIVTTKEITLLHWGASPPKTAIVPGVVPMRRVVTPPPHPLWMRMPSAATDAIARMYFLTVTHLRQSRSAKAPVSKIAAVPLAILPTMLLNNRPAFEVNRRYNSQLTGYQLGGARQSRGKAAVPLWDLNVRGFWRDPVPLGIQLDFCASLWYVGSSDIKGARLKLVCIRSFG